MCISQFCISETVDTTSRPEPTTDEAMTMLQDRVSRGNLVVSIQVDAQKVLADVVVILVLRKIHLTR